MLVKPFARVDEIKVGDKVITDGGFTCIKNYEIKKVKQDKDGLYISCKYGKHYLCGQLGGPFGGFETYDHYVGLTKMKGKLK